MTVAFFDLDRTVIDLNSGTSWLKMEWREGRVSTRDAVWAASVLARYALGQGALEEAYDAAVAKYAGVPEVEISDRTRAWFFRDIAHRVRPGARRAIAKHRAAGDRLVIATSSSVYAAGAAREAYGFDDVVASSFEVAPDGRFTGRLASSAYGKAKADRAAEWASARAIDLSTCTFYTDSITDLALMERVGRPVAVNPDRPLRRMATQRGWSIEDWQTSNA